MSIFNSYSKITETAPVFEGYTEENYGDILALEESYEDYVSIIEAMYKLEAAELNYIQKVAQVTENYDLSESEREESLDNIEDEWGEAFEAANQNIFQSVINYLKNLWGRITSFFVNVGRSFLALFLSGKTFAERYENDLKNANLSGFKYEMFDYTNMEISSAGENLFKIADGTIKRFIGNIPDTEEALDKHIEKIQENRANIIATIRGEYVGKGALESGEFNKALYAIFRGGAINEADKRDISVNIKEIISILKDDQKVKNIKKATKACNVAFDKKIKEIKDAENKYKKASNNEKDKRTASKIISAMNKEISIFNESRGIAMTMFRAWRTAVQERDRVYKSVCLAALRYKGK